MEHSEAEALALAALGEPSLHARDARHLRECAACADELERLTSTVGLARGTDVDAGSPQEVVPPDSVWDAVAAELGFSATPQYAQAAAPARPPHRPTASWVRWAGAAAGVAVLAGASGVVGALVAGGDRVVVAPTTTVTETAPPDVGRVVARAALAPLEDGGSAGAARVLDTGTGTVLEVDLTDRPSTDGYLEVWLIDPDTFQMVSVGTLPV